MDESHGQTSHIETIVIGGGQAGLSMGHHLQRHGRPFLILDANAETGDVWRHRWDSLRLFTPARFSGLDGMRFPGDPDEFPTKDEMADYLQSYAAQFDLPIRHGVRVDRVSRLGEQFIVRSGNQEWTADNVVVAMGSLQRPHVPTFSAEIGPTITQVHAAAYGSPDSLADGDVLVVGAGNSGTEIAMDITRQSARGERKVYVAGRDTGHLPFRIAGRFGRLIGVRLVLRFLFMRVLNVRTPIGRRARPKILTRGGPLIRVMPRDLAAADIQRLPRVEGARDGLPVLADGRALSVSNIIWCTGYEHGFPWIDLPVHGELEPLHRSGIVDSQPGLYFLGLLFLDSLSSEMIHGVGRDARRIAAHLDSRPSSATRADGPARHARRAAA